MTFKRINPTTKPQQKISFMLYKLLNQYLNLCFIALNGTGLGL